MWLAGAEVLHYGVQLDYNKINTKASPPSSTLLVAPLAPAVVITFQNWPIYSRYRLRSVLQKLRSKTGTEFVSRALLKCMFIRSLELTQIDFLTPWPKVSPAVFAAMQVYPVRLV